MDFLSVIFFIIILACFAFLAMVFTKYIAKKTKHTMMGKHLSIIESISLGGLDKKLHLVKAGKEYVLIAVTTKNVEYITTVTIEENNNNENSEESNEFDFKKNLESYLKLIKIGSKKILPQKQEEVKLQEIRQNSRFKSNLDRIKSMTSVMDKNDVLGEDEVTDEKE